VFWADISLKLLPWDWDVDTQVSEATLVYMADNLNQTTYDFVSDDKKIQRKYFLDVNPYARKRDRGKALNVIDARWIDVRNGLFIDITGLRELKPDSEPGVVSCKNYHNYNITNLYPLRESEYEGAPARIPYNYAEVLISEYGEKAVIDTQYRE
jgi:hypothetical protein